MNNETIYGLLNNGLRIVISPRQETIAVATWVFTHGGSDYETQDDNGIDHFLEHMYFKGTNTDRYFSPNDIWRAIEGRGGEMNAQTDKEMVGYGTVMNYNNLELNLELLSDILLNSRFDLEAIETERKVILEEKKAISDVPQGTIYELWDTGLHPGCAWSFPIIGSRESIEAITREKLLSRMEKYYRAGSTVLSIAGRVDPCKVIELADKYFSNMPKGRAPGKPKGFESQQAPYLYLKFRKTEQTHLMLGVRGYNLFHPQKCAFEILGVILGGNSSSRLFNKIREDRGLAYQIHTHNHSYTDRGELATYVGIDHANLLETVQLILEEYRNVATEGITRQELEEAQEFLLGQRSRLFEGSSDLAAFLGVKKLLGDPIATVQQEIEEIKKVKPEDVNWVAQDIFQTKKLNLFVLGPHRKRRHLEKELMI